VQESQAFTVAFSTNEEKIKEIWSKSLYSLFRCEDGTFFTYFAVLLSGLFVYSYKNKQHYEQFILRRLEFESLFSEMNSRVSSMVSSTVEINLNLYSPDQSDFTTAQGQIKGPLEKYLTGIFIDGSTKIANQLNYLLKRLTRL